MDLCPGIHHCRSHTHCLGHLAQEFSTGESSQLSVDDIEHCLAVHRTGGVGPEDFDWSVALPMYHVLCDIHSGVALLFPVDHLSHVAHLLFVSTQLHEIAVGEGEEEEAS